MQHHQVVGEPIDARQRHSPQQRRLAHAVATHQTVVPARVETQRGPRQQLVAIDGDVHALQVDITAATERTSAARQEDGVNTPLVVLPLVHDLSSVRLLALLLLLLLDLHTEETLLGFVTMHKQVFLRLEIGGVTLLHRLGAVRIGKSVKHLSQVGNGLLHLLGVGARLCEEGIWE